MSTTWKTAAAYEASKCPGCQTERGKSIFRETWEGVPLEIVVCAECGLGYSNPRPTEASKLARYEEWSQRERPNSTEAHYDHSQQLRHFYLYRKVMRLIEARMPRGMLLDVGCAGGLFVVFAGVYASEDNSGVNSRYQAEGAAFDPHEAELAKRISGAPVHLISELAGLPAGSYDAITLLNVLEHVNEPVELLGKLRRLLRKGGALIIVVPNYEMAFARLRMGIGARQASFAAGEHINHFRPASLRRMLERAGFSNMHLVAAQPAGTYGSMSRPPWAQYAKHCVYLALDMLTASRCYLYSELIAVAE
jgi:2-polyprenyl-3-methyl-5-hydroxy-6-metoxy-1,4-benzoquinol methylase